MAASVNWEAFIRGSFKRFWCDIRQVSSWSLEEPHCHKLGVLFGGPYMRDPIILRPY